MGREFRLLCGFLLLAIGTASSRQSYSAVVLDQALGLSTSYAVDFDWNQELRQSFTVEAAGLVSKFGVQIFRTNDSFDTSGEVLISIGSQALPMTTYYTARVPVSEIPVVNSSSEPVPWTYVDVARGKRMVQPGDNLGIKVSQMPSSLNEGATNVYWRTSGFESSYAGGSLIRRIPPYSTSELWGNFGDGDGGFQTFVETAAVRQSASFTPVFDVQAEAPHGGQYSLSDGSSQIFNQALAPPNYEGLERRGLVEFDLRALPANALITAAYLDLQISNFVPGSKEAGFSMVSIAGYGGTGAADASKAALQTPALESRSVNALGVISFYLNVSALEQLLAGSDYLGLVTRALPTQYQSGFYTSEQAANEPGVLAPTLRLEYITALSAGDYNGDGAVDAADYVALRKRGGTQIEYNVWRSNYGDISAGPQALSLESPVPEPAGLLLALIATALTPSALLRSARCRSECA